MPPEQPSPARRTTLYSAAQLEVVMDGMAARLAGLLPAEGPITVVGVLRRGAPLADRLCARLKRNLRHNGDAMDIARLDLRIKRYADDLTLLHPETRLTETPGHDLIDLAGHTLVVVDDVLYHGHSLLRAVRYLVQKQPAAIRSVVLADRGIAKLPIHADVTGVRLDIADGDIVECNVPPYEDEFRMDIFQPSPC